MADYSHSMNEDPNIWFHAYSMMRRHGAAAAEQVALELGERLGAGDMKGAMIWRQVAGAISQIALEKRLN